MRLTKLTLHYLLCVQSQEGATVGGINVSDDEIRLELGSLVVARANMLPGQTLTDFSQSVFEFEHAPEFRLYEEDVEYVGDGDDLLGAWTVETVKGVHVAHFAQSGAYYMLQYEVEPPPDPTSPSERCGAPPGETLAYVTCGHDVPESQRFDEYREIIESLGVFLEDGYNLIGLRCLDYETREIVENTWNAWNDTLAVVWLDAAGTKRVVEYQGTCDPGKHSKTAHEDGEDANPNGLAHLCDGQWEYECGYHHGSYPCLVQKEDVTVWRSQFGDDGWANNTFEEGEQTDTGIFGINIHASKDNSSGVYNWSAGCQVFRSSKGAGTRYAEVMGSGTKGDSEHGGYVGEHFETHDVIYYTVVTAREKGTEEDNVPCACEAGDGEVGAGSVACPQEGAS